MSDQGTSVTLIFYKVGPDWWREPALNLIAAAAQFSSYTHVELAVGETAGSNGQMANVVRIFNDPHGVELCERTGRNPQVRLLPLILSRPSVLALFLFGVAFIFSCPVSVVLAVYVLVHRLLAPRRAAHAGLRARPGGQALLQHGHGALAPIPAQDLARIVLLRGAGGRGAQGGGVDVSCRSLPHSLHSRCQVQSPALTVSDLVVLAGPSTATQALPPRTACTNCTASRPPPRRIRSRFDRSVA